MAGVDRVYHCAALKCVDTLEDNPYEAIYTNLMGTKNVVKAAKEQKITTLVMASTDKAVFPINIYGMTKAAAEKIVLSEGYSVCRYGNVIGSRGSVVPMFVKAIQANEPIKITSPDMTRFWIRMEDAASFIYGLGSQAYGYGLSIPPMKAAPVIMVAKVIAGLLGKNEPEIEIVGIRKGEKMHECLYSDEKDSIFSNTCTQYTETELKELLEPFVRQYA
jgi:FlaA1/EpsC-like NDP-sugar epimerase